MLSKLKTNNHYNYKVPLLFAEYLRPIVFILAVHNSVTTSPNNCHGYVRDKQDTHTDKFVSY
jgi:hypothetical protein